MTLTIQRTVQSNVELTHAITPDIVNNIKTLTRQDIEDDPSWMYAPVTVTTNYVRQKINIHKVTLYATENSEPIL